MSTGEFVLCTYIGRPFESMLRFIWGPILNFTLRGKLWIPDPRGEVVSQEWTLFPRGVKLSPRGWNYLFFYIVESVRPWGRTKGPSSLLGANFTPGTNNAVKNWPLVCHCQLNLAYLDFPTIVCIHQANKQLKIQTPVENFFMLMPCI
jgi:hypothetical protein